MPDRDVLLVALRPTVPAAVESVGKLEAFQDRTLRPILKLQNPLILTLVMLYLKKYCSHFEKMPVEEQIAFVRNVLKRDSRPKHMLVGLVVGHFTKDEFAFFIEHEAEVRRRVVELCITRVQDQLDRLFPGGDGPSVTER